MNPNFNADFTSKGHDDQVYEETTKMGGRWGRMLPPHPISVHHSLPTSTTHN